MRKFAPEPRLSPEELLELRGLIELGRLSATLLHQISNPLTAALLHLEASPSADESVAEARRSILLLRDYVEATRQQVHKQSPLTGCKKDYRLPPN